MWDCEGDKSLGLGDFNFKFIKEFWEILKGDFLRLMIEFNSQGVLPRGGNPSFLDLILKKDNPQCPSDFRPISLIGCIYKVIVKVLSIRLRMVIGKVIDEKQSASVGGGGGGYVRWGVDRK